MILAAVWNAIAEEKTVEFPPVMRDFAYVFPVELPGLPLLRNVEFTIDLLPGTAPIALPLYRMALAEQIGFKKQLTELENLSFNDCSVEQDLWWSGNRP